MSRASCPQEAAVTTAARAGELPETLAAHASGCAVCREIVQTSRWLQSLAEGTASGAALPDAELLWSRARYAERMEQATRERKALEWAEMLSGAAVPVALAGWVAWNWFGIQAQAVQLLAEDLSRFPLAVYAFASLAPALLFLGAISLAYPLLVRE